MSSQLEQFVCRKGEGEQVWSRMDRFYQVEGEWYFSVREGDDMGPFASYEASKCALTEYLRALVNVNLPADIQI